jgi:hypothetical protein
VVVHNSANKGQVNGELVDLNALNSNTSSAAGQLAAAIPSLVAFPAPFNETTDVKATADSKLKVGWLVLSCSAPLLHPTPNPTLNATLPHHAIQVTQGACKLQHSTQQAR